MAKRVFANNSIKSVPIGPVWCIGIMLAIDVCPPLPVINMGFQAFLADQECCPCLEHKDIPNNIIDPEGRLWVRLLNSRGVSPGCLQIKQGRHAG